MNVRCYRCGWSWSLSHDTLEEAAVNAAGQAAYVIHCPRCRQAIRVPMDQIMRAWPPGWTPPAPAPTGATAAEPAAAQPEPKTDTAELAETPRQPSGRRHRHSGKAHSVDSAASTAKQNNHPN